MRKRVATWQALALFLGLAVSEAGTWYVAPDGDDSGPGTFEKPWRNPIKAAGRLGPGDTLVFRAGEYRCNTDGVVGLGPSRSGEEGKPITFTTYNNEHVKIDCTGSDWGFTPNGWSWIVIEGFEITNPTHYGMKISKGHGEEHYSDHVTIRDCEIHHTGGECIFALNATHLTIENCYVHDSGYSHGFYINKGCHNLLIRNVTSENNRGNSAIRINASGGGTRDGVIERCLMRGCALASSFLGAINCIYRENILFNNGFDGPRGSGHREIVMRNGDELGGKGTTCEGDLFENNTIVNLMPRGHKLNQLVHIMPQTRNCVFRNNIFVVRGVPIFTLDSFEGLVFENNCLYRIGGGEEVRGGGRLVDFCRDKGLKARGNISADPLFVDMEKGDFRLRDGSPCVGAGVPRNGEACDIGAVQRSKEIQIGCRLPWKK